MQEQRYEVLEEGDELISFLNDKIAVKKETGELEIHLITIDEYGLARIEDSILLTFRQRKNKEDVSKNAQIKKYEILEKGDQVINFF